MNKKIKRWLKILLLCLLICLLPVSLIAGLLVYESVPSVAAKKILSHANLAPLPKSCSDIKAYHWSTLFSGVEYLSFKASKEDIEIFLASSPILEGKKCEVYSAHRMRIPFPKDYGQKEEHFNTPHEFYQPRPGAPEWYKGELKGNGRRYEIQPEGYHYPGEVIIDDESNVVFVMLVFS